MSKNRAPAVRRRRPAQPVGFRRSLGFVFVLTAAAITGHRPAGAGDDQAFIQPGATGHKLRNQAPDRELREILCQIDRKQLESTVPNWAIVVEMLRTRPSITIAQQTVIE